ncbi:MAG: patatin-like phospholipase family protein [Bacteroidales bacterium]|jgi:NTE family protein|nr:patatin-like phospholipase family protein [Bacteroidales bacterium]
MAKIFNKKKYNYGIALSGGGARGYAHLGVLKALEEKGIKPDILSGTSAGAIAGAFIAAGKTPMEAFELFKKQKLSHFVEIKMPKTGLLNLEKLRDSLAGNIDADDLKDLKIPFYVTVSNIIDGKVEYFNKGPLVKLVQASASIPVLFAPVEIDGKLYSDGGLFDNVPVEPLKGKCKKIIAVNISPINKTDKVKNLIQIAARTFHLSVNSTTRGLKDNCDLVIAPPDLGKFEILDASKADEIFKVGYDYCKNLDIDL